MDRRSLVAGGILILVGILFFLGNYIDFYWEEVWPLWMIFGGLVFLGLYLANRRNYGFLMPAAVLLSQGALFQFCAWDNRWYYMGELWPVFILGPGLGFLLMYFFGKRETGFVIPAFILIGLSLIFFVTLGPFRAYSDFWPVLLILAGLFLVFRRRKPDIINGN